MSDTSLVKSWFLMRLDLPMSQGKFGVQIGHGTDMIHLTSANNPYYSRWVDPAEGNRRKIVLRAKNVADLEKIKADCEAVGMTAIFIVDAGYTEFNGPTISGLVVCPHDDALIPSSLKRAQSWRPTDANHG